jgi:hypothetical protein
MVRMSEYHQIKMSLEIEVKVLDLQVALHMCQVNKHQPLIDNQLPL